MSGLVRPIGVKGARVPISGEAIDWYAGGILCHSTHAKEHMGPTTDLMGLDRLTRSIGDDVVLSERRAPWKQGNSSQGRVAANCGRPFRSTSRERVLSGSGGDCPSGGRETSATFHQASGTRLGRRRKRHHHRAGRRSIRER